MNIKEKVFQCRRCGTTFTMYAKKAYYCPNCRKKHSSEYVMQKRALKNPKIKIGVGSGGNQLGRKNHQYKTGRSHYRQIFIRENSNQNHCEICFSTENLVVHHIDKDRSNNAKENLIMICRSCHSQVHQLDKNFSRRASQ